MNVGYARFSPIIISAMLTSQAVAQPADFCTPSGNAMSLNFDIRPSLVVNSDAVLDTTFGDAGIGGGDPGESLFSFKHTIGSILETAGVPNTETDREAFVQTMLDTFGTADTVALNHDAGVLVPLDERTAESLVLPTQLLADGPPHGMKPLALFNRFDLAPDNWSHCGEHRIVYGKSSASALDRFTLIFEGVAPNPDPAQGEDGCRPITEFWAGLGGTDAEIAESLHAFFYEGKTDPGLPESDIGGPIVSFRNYGGDGGRGQVRGNLFMQFPWQLREWLTLPTLDPDQPLAFVVETVKDNPIAELYRDDLSGTDIATTNVPSALTVLHGDFVQALTTTIRDRLMTEETDEYEALNDGLEDYNLGAAPVDEQDVLLNTIALGNENRFNEHQSTSLGPDDDIGQTHVGPASALRTILGHLTSLPSQDLSPQTADVFLARAQAGTCAGCHMLSASPNVVVRINPDSPDVLWPDVAIGGFVHVLESDRSLSPALEDDFLPFRRYVMGRHLCPPTAPAPESTSEQMVAEATSMRFLDDTIATYFTSKGQDGPEAAASQSDGNGMLMAATKELDAADRMTLRSKIIEQIAEARSSERRRPGAFVETRRPH